MDAALIKVVCSFASVAAGIASCAYWYRSSKAEVLEKDALPDDISFDHRGKSIALVATTKKQSQLSANGALYASLAALAQVVSLMVDTIAPLFP